MNDQFVQRSKARHYESKAACIVYLAALSLLWETDVAMFPTTVPIAIAGSRRSPFRAVGKRQSMGCHP
jgi:hypothetical protein